MKPGFLFAPALLSALCLVMPARAEDIEHTQQLMSTKQCQQCDLSRAGLVYANLTGADLTGANLVQANLSHATLANANFQSASLAGAVLFGANLAGADLTGADLTGADLRNAILSGAKLEGTKLDGAQLLGAVGLTEEIATEDNLYAWGLAESQRGNYRGAIANYNQALRRDPDFAHAYLARGIARYHLGDYNGALQDAQQADQLYQTENNAEGQELAMKFSDGILAIQEAAEDRQNEERGGLGHIFSALTSVAGLALRFLMP